MSQPVASTSTARTTPRPASTAPKPRVLPGAWNPFPVAVAASKGKKEKRRAQEASSSTEGDLSDGFFEATGVIRGTRKDKGKQRAKPKAKRRKEEVKGNGWSVTEQTQPPKRASSAAAPPSRAPPRPATAPFHRTLPLAASSQPRKPQEVVSLPGPAPPSRPRTSVRSQPPLRPPPSRYGPRASARPVDGGLTATPASPPFRPPSTAIAKQRTSPTYSPPPAHITHLEPVPQLGLSPVRSKETRGSAPAATLFGEDVNFGATPVLHPSIPRDTTRSTVSPVKRVDVLAPPKSILPAAPSPPPSRALNETADPAPPDPALVSDAAHPVERFDNAAAVPSPSEKLEDPLQAPSADSAAGLAVDDLFSGNDSLYASEPDDAPSTPLHDAEAASQPVANIFDDSDSALTYLDEEDDPWCPQPPLPPMRPDSSSALGGSVARYAQPAPVPDAVQQPPSGEMLAPEVQLAAPTAPGQNGLRLFAPESAAMQMGDDSKLIETGPDITTARSSGVPPATPHPASSHDREASPVLPLATNATATPPKLDLPLKGDDADANRSPARAPDSPLVQLRARTSPGVARKSASANHASVLPPRGATGSRVGELVKVDAFGPPPAPPSSDRLPRPDRPASRLSPELYGEAPAVAVDIQREPKRPSSSPTSARKSARPSQSPSASRSARPHVSASPSVSSPTPSERQLRPRSSLTATTLQRTDSRGAVAPSSACVAAPQRILPERSASTPGRGRKAAQPQEPNPPASSDEDIGPELVVSRATATPAVRSLPGPAKKSASSKAGSGSPVVGRGKGEKQQGKGKGKIKGGAAEGKKGRKKKAVKRTLGVEGEWWDLDLRDVGREGLVPRDFEAPQQAGLRVAQGGDRYVHIGFSLALSSLAEKDACRSGPPRDLELDLREIVLPSTDVLESTLDSGEWLVGLRISLELLTDVSAAPTVYDYELQASFKLRRTSSTSGFHSFTLDGSSRFPFILAATAVPPSTPLCLVITLVDGSIALVAEHAFPSLAPFTGHIPFANSQSSRAGVSISLVALSAPGDASVTSTSRDVADDLAHRLARIALEKATPGGVWIPDAIAVRGHEVEREAMVPHLGRGRFAYDFRYKLPYSPGDALPLLVDDTVESTRALMRGKDEEISRSAMSPEENLIARAQMRWCLLNPYPPTVYHRELACWRFYAPLVHHFSLRWHLALHLVEHLLAHQLVTEPQLRAILHAYDDEVSRITSGERAGYEEWRRSEEWTRSGAS
ncbi:hypothetical protein Rhopal_007847-T1 [Rhodotorula paludigena]|uniref:Proteophosphoglycan ppg4 n=1 Tax=Rhodotorula paludigena TaxID=86838 RepID=A0AAV5GZ73_9BASI|nr:hypothetical protein Rhopal_007847-T1 [Rhodotorula paludigena]